MTVRFSHPALWGALGLLAAAPPAQAEEPRTIEVTIKDHRFQPAEIHVQAGKPVFLHITNQGTDAEEFEMLPLAIEKVLPPGSEGKVRIGPLGPGRDPFLGEFHKDTAQGAIISE